MHENLNCYLTVKTRPLAVHDKTVGSKNYCAKRLLRPCEPQFSDVRTYMYVRVRNLMLADENYFSAFWTLWAGGSLKKSQMVQKGDPHKQSFSNEVGTFRDPFFSSFFRFFEKSFYSKEMDGNKENCDFGIYTQVIKWKK